MSGDGKTRWFIPNEGSDGKTQNELLKDALVKREEALSDAERSRAKIEKGMKKTTEVALKSAATVVVGTVPGTEEAISYMWLGTFD